MGRKFSIISNLVSHLEGFLNHVTKKKNIPIFINCLKGVPLARESFTSDLPHNVSAPCALVNVVFNSVILVRGSGSRVIFFFF